MEKLFFYLLVERRTMLLVVCAALRVHIAHGACGGRKGKYFWLLLSLVYIISVVDESTFDSHYYVALLNTITTTDHEELYTEK